MTKGHRGALPPFGTGTVSDSWYFVGRSRKGFSWPLMIPVVSQQRLSDLTKPYWNTYRIAYRVLQPLLVKGGITYGTDRLAIRRPGQKTHTKPGKSWNLTMVSMQSCEINIWVLNLEKNGLLHHVTPGKKTCYHAI